MKETICYIPVLNCEQLGVYKSHDAAMIRLIKELCISYHDEVIGFDELDFCHIIFNVINNDNFSDICWIEEMKLYE